MKRICKVYVNKELYDVFNFSDSDSFIKNLDETSKKLGNSTIHISTIEVIFAYGRISMASTFTYYSYLEFMLFLTGMKMVDEI